MRQPTASCGGRVFSDSEQNTLAGAFATSPDDQKRKRTGSKIIGSERRGFKLMTVVPVDEGDDEVKKATMVVKSKFGKTRPLNAEGKFMDRPRPPGDPSPAVERLEVQRRHAEAEQAAVREEALEAALAALRAREEAERREAEAAEEAERKALNAWARRETTDADLGLDEDDILGPGVPAATAAARRSTGRGGRPLERDPAAVARQEQARTRALAEARREAEDKANPKAMPYVYASEGAAVVLTRGQYLDLAEAKAKASERAEKRAADAAAEKKMVDEWMCDPRMLPGWTVHYRCDHATSQSLSIVFLSQAPAQD